MRKIRFLKCRRVNQPDLPRRRIGLILASMLPKMGPKLLPAPPRRSFVIRVNSAIYPPVPYVFGAVGRQRAEHRPHEPVGELLGHTLGAVSSRPPAVGLWIVFADDLYPARRGQRGEQLA